MNPETIVSTSARTVAFEVLKTPDDLRVPFTGAFAVLVWSSKPNAEVAEQAALFDHLFRKGCRYVVAGGIECERWHDVADEQFLETFPTKEGQDANFVMTSWHTDESENEVAFFFMHCAAPEQGLFSQFLAVQFGEDHEARKRLIAAIQRESSVAAV